MTIAPVIFMRKERPPAAAPDTLEMAIIAQVNVLAFSYFFMASKAVF